MYWEMPEINCWTSIGISQSSFDNNVHKLTVKVNNKEKLTIENTLPAEFFNVAIFASSRSDAFIPQPGSIRNLVIKTKLEGKAHK
jgi:hypothetical protein